MKNLLLLLIAVMFFSCTDNFQPEELDDSKKESLLQLKDGMLVIR